MAAPKEKSKVITAIVLDFETGCGPCQESGATQLSAQAIRLDTFECMDSFNEYIKPYNKAKISGSTKKVLVSKYEKDQVEPMMYDEPKMIAYTGISLDLLKEKGLELTEVMEKFLDFIERNTFDVGKNNKPILIGQNVLFDIGFLTQVLLFTGCYKRFTRLVRGEVDYWGNFQPYYMDTILYSQFAMSHLGTQNSWSLSFLAETLGIELVDAHDADADVSATTDIARVLTKRLRSGDGESEDDGIAEVKKEKFRTHFKI